MKIFYINVIEKNKGWGAECFVNRGFIKNGHTTINLDYRINRYNLSSKFLTLNRDFDALFLQRGDWFPIELLKAIKRPRFFWASELVSRCRDQDRLLKSGLFEHIFVHSSNCKKTICSKKWITEDRISVLLNGFDETVHFKIPNIKKDIDILFIGNILPRRKIWLENLRKHFKITVARAFGEEMTKLFNRSKIILNIHAEEYIDIETRVFETLGCGSFLLSEELSTDNPFSSGKHLIEVSNIQEMIEKIEYYLVHDNEREYITYKGHIEALTKHTYTRRAEEISRIFSNYLEHYIGPAIDKKVVYSYQEKEKLIKEGD